MRRPWQVWLLFLLCLLAVVPPMVWVTSKAIDLEQAEMAARVQAEQEELVGSALWRMDARLMPLLAEEAARPDFAFQPPTDGDVPNLEPGNYLQIAPDHVLLHFELKPTGEVSSPQIARASKSAAGDYGERLAALSQSVSYERLLPELPERTLPSLSMVASGAEANAEPIQIVANSASAEPEPTQAASDAEPASAYSANGPVQQRAGSNQVQSDAQSDQYAQVGGYGLNNSFANASRAGRDLRQRNNAYQSLAQQALERQQRLNGGKTAAKPVAPRPTTIREGISRPVWIDDKLLFAHRVQRGDNTVIQGCWLDWAGLRSELLSEVADLLPGADLVAAPPGERWHVLATLPVQLTVPVPPLPDSGWSPIRLALAAVWGCLAMAALACAWLLAGVVALSERRASFVSAVTHELRTPLTTFRMYAEMLAGDMVPSPEQRKKYLETLCVEADRLTHLVDNVLLYARLERCKPGKNRTTVTASQLVDRFDSRLSDRAAQADMQLQLHVSDEVNQVTLSTDPGAVEQIIFNLVDNACKYASPTDDRRIVLSVEPAGAQLNLSVRDFGPGLSKAARRRLFEPFSKSSEEAAVTAPGVGLGLALCRRLATELGGRLTLREASPGAEFVLSLPRGSSA